MSGPPAPGLLVASELTCGYARSGRTVLGRVNLSLQRGRLVCIVGPNGAGKTTLIRTLAGLLEPLGGQVTLGGRPLGEQPPLERARQLSVVLTQLVSPGYLRVRRFVELGRHPHTGFLARLRPIDVEAVDAALAQTGIVHLAGRWMAEISDGEKQRTAIARALAQAADVMILDEPTAFLDVAARATIMTSLKAIAHRLDRLIVASSHDIELVLRTADLIGVVRSDGSLSIGCPEDLVLDGAMDHLFPDQSLRFDPATGTFRLPPPDGPAVLLHGSGLYADWTAHALERIGREVVRAGRKRDRAGGPEPTPVRAPTEAGRPWRIGEPAREAWSLSELTDLLRL